MIKHLTLPKKWLQWYFLPARPQHCACAGGLRPTKQIELVVPYAAGGGTDLVARAFADAAKTICPSASGLSINTAVAALSA